MKSKRASAITAFALTAFLVSVALPAAAVAAEGDRYWGVKSGLVMVDVEGFPDVDDIIPVTGILGYGVGPDLAIEGELTLSIAGGDVEGFDAEADVTAIGAFLAYRPAIDNNKYFKGKVGLVNGEAEVCNGGCVSDDDTALAFGVGLGFRTSARWTWEVGYTMYDFEDTDADYLSVGVIVPF